MIGAMGGGEPEDGDLVEGPAKIPVPDEVADAGWDYGFPLARLREVNGLPPDPEVAEVLQNLGLDASAEQPKLLTRDTIAARPGACASTMRRVMVSK